MKREAHLITLTKITKNFGGVQALKGVEIKVDRGEVHAVIGENGAGKSTLMNIIAGILKPDGGAYSLEETPVSFSTPAEAEKRGIVMVSQEQHYFPDLTVLENICFNREALGRTGQILWDRMAEQVIGTLNKIGVDRAILGRAMHELPIGAKQMILLARAIHARARLLILDEPTSSLSAEETRILFRLINELKEEGTGILYISHRIEEIIEISETITILRDGAVTACLPTKEANRQKLIYAMSGREIDTRVHISRPFADREELFRADSLTSQGGFEDITFAVRPGEILGFYGLVGAGRSEVAEALIGERKITSGSLRFKDQPYIPRRAGYAFQRGISYLTEDRKNLGIFSSRPVRDNMIAGLLGKLCSRLTVIKREQEQNIVAGNIKRYAVKLHSMEDKITSLSGGNQQKVLFVRGLIHDPDLLILDEPTRGIDVGTKTDIHKIIMELALRGKAIILITSEITELLALGDNFIIFKEGRISGTLDRESVSEERVLRLALGVRE